MYSRKKRKIPLYQHQIQEDLDNIVSSIQVKLDLYDKLKSLVDDLPNDLEMHRALIETRQEIRDSIVKLRSSGYSTVDLLSRFGATLFKGALVDAEHKIQQKEETSQHEFIVTDLVNEDDILRNRAGKGKYDETVLHNITTWDAERMQLAADQRLVAGNKQATLTGIQRLKQHPHYWKVKEISDRIKRQRHEQIVAEEPEHIAAEREEIIRRQDDEDQHDRDEEEKAFEQLRDPDILPERSPARSIQSSSSDDQAPDDQSRAQSHSTILKREILMPESQSQSKSVKQVSINLLQQPEQEEEKHPIGEALLPPKKGPGSIVSGKSFKDVVTKPPSIEQLDTLVGDKDPQQIFNSMGYRYETDDVDFKKKLVDIDSDPTYATVIDKFRQAMIQPDIRYTDGTDNIGLIYRFFYGDKDKIDPFQFKKMVISEMQLADQKLSDPTQMYKMASAISSSNANEQEKRELLSQYIVHYIADETEKDQLVDSLSRLALVHLQDLITHFSASEDLITYDKAKIYINMLLNQIYWIPGSKFIDKKPNQLAVLKNLAKIKIDDIVPKIGGNITAAQLANTMSTIQRPVLGGTVIKKWLRRYYETLDATGSSIQAANAALQVDAKKKK